MHNLKFSLVGIVSGLLLILLAAPTSSGLVALAAQNQTGATTLYLPAIMNAAAALAAPSAGGGALGVIVDENLTVLEIEPESAAAQALVQSGDILITIEGIAFRTDRAAAKRIINEATSGAQLHLQLMRANHVIAVVISPAPAIPHPNAPTATPVPPSQDYF